MHKNTFSGKLHSVSLVESRSFSGPVRNRPPVNLTYSLSPDILSMILARIFNTLILVLLFYNCLDNCKQQQILHIHFSQTLFPWFWRGFSAIVQFTVWDSETPETPKTPRLPRLPRLLSYYFSIFLYFRFTTFANFSNSSDSKVKVKGPNICYIFEKHGIQGCWI